MRCLPVLVIMCIGLGAAHGQDITVGYFPADVNEPIDLKNPALQDVLITLGLAPDPATSDQFLQQVLDLHRESRVEALAFAVRITNRTGSPIPITRENVQLALVSHGDGAEEARRVDKHIPASPITNWAGAKSLFAKGQQLAAGATVDGVVYFELSQADAQTAATLNKEVDYKPQEGDPVAGVITEGLLESLGLTWKTPIARAPKPPAGRPRVFPARGNVDDNTPLRLSAPGEITPRPDSPVVAHKNIVAEQMQQPGMGMPGMGMPGMGMPGMGMPGMGMPGMGMPGMGMPGMGMPGMGMPGMGMPGMGMPGMGMPGMGMPGGAPGMPGMPGAGPAMPGGAPGVQPGAPGAGADPGRRRPRRPGGAEQ